MKILCIKDHVRSSINDFRERIRAITNPGRPFEKEEEVEEDDEQSGFLQISEIHYSCIF